MEINRGFSTCGIDHSANLGAVRNIFSKVAGSLVGNCKDHDKQFPGCPFCECFEEKLIRIASMEATSCAEYRGSGQSSKSCPNM